MPEVPSPATPEQINAFLDTVLPLLEEEYSKMLTLSDAAISNSVSMRHLAQIDASLTRRYADETKAFQRSSFFSRVNTQVSDNNAWARDFFAWCTYVLESFVSESVERRIHGLVYTLPNGLVPVFEAFNPEDRAQTLARLSRPQLHVGLLDSRTDVLVFRQIG